MTPVHKKFDHICIYIYIYIYIYDTYYFQGFSSLHSFVAIYFSILSRCKSLILFFLSRKGSCNLQIRIIDHLGTKCTGLIRAMIDGAISWVLVAPVAMAMGLLHGMLYRSLSSIVWIAYKVEYGSKLFFQFFYGILGGSCSNFLVTIS